jgi:hypothetical protein
VFGVTQGACGCGENLTPGWCARALRPRLANSFAVCSRLTRGVRGRKNVGRKVLQDFANTLCQMLVGWRMGEDLELLAELPDGTLDIDVLSGSTTHSVNGRINLHIAGELQAWLKHRISEARVEPSSIALARVTAIVRTDRIATDRKRIVSFDFAVDSIIEAADREYRGRLCEAHQWHSRVPSNNRVQATRETRAPDA